SFSILSVTILFVKTLTNIPVVASTTTITMSKTNDTFVEILFIFIRLLLSIYHDAGLFHILVYDLLFISDDLVGVLDYISFNLYTSTFLSIIYTIKRCSIRDIILCRGFHFVSIH